MKKKKNKCIRCEVLEKKVINEGKHSYIGPNGVRGLVCEECLEELKNEDEWIMLHEIEED